MTTASLLHAHNITTTKLSLPTIKASSSSSSHFENQNAITNRRKTLTTLLTTSLALAAVTATTTPPPLALAENWGTRSFLKEKFFEPGLSPEDSAARIRQTAEGLHSMREMLERMAWRYVIFYIRLKQSYLSQDLTTAMTTLPKDRWNDYVKTANELVDNMSEVINQFLRCVRLAASKLCTNCYTGSSIGLFGGLSSFCVSGEDSRRGSCWFRRSKDLLMASCISGFIPLSSSLIVMELGHQKVERPPDRPM